MKEQVIKTYTALISQCKKLPGGRLEDLGWTDALDALEQELAWLKALPDETETQNVARTTG